MVERVTPISTDCLPPITWLLAISVCPSSSYGHLVYLVAGPIVTTLIRVWSSRVVGAIGCAFMVAGLIAAAYVPNIIWLCCSFSIFCGKKFSSMHTRVFFRTNLR